MYWTILGLAAVAAASPLEGRWNDVVQKHSWLSVPEGWQFHDLPPADHLLNLRIGLKKGNRDELIRHLLEVSSPKHERYGKHLSKGEVHELVRPHASTVEAVGDWFAHHGIDESAISRSEAGEWVTITVPVAQAERMLGATYGVYHHTNANDYAVRTMSYSLPRELHEHIKVVSPTTYFGTMKSMRATSFKQPEIDEKISSEAAVDADPSTDATVPSSCKSRITPDCLKAIYNTADFTPQPAGNNTLGIAGYLDEFANDDDLQTFFDRFLPDASGTTFEHVQVNDGGNDQNDPGVEANLDIQYTEGISWPIPNVYFSTGGSPPFDADSQTPTNTNEPYLDWVNFVLSQDSIPQTISTSYGDDEQTVPEDYAREVCDLFAELGVRGTTLLFSSGDFGVGGGDCKNNDGSNDVAFQPAFPASCPFVTTVGGTTGVPEVTVDFSGGGFSRYFEVPDYQADVVGAYVDGLNGDFDGLFNASGRAYPDVAAQGSGFQVVIGGSTSSVGGTSASAPTVAGIVALLNDVRLAAGQPSLGFLNPLIYENADAFNDITSGSNPGCGTDGFEAKEGWDPATGLGTPDFLKLKDVVSAA